jgi:cell division protein FtsL
MATVAAVYPAPRTRAKRPRHQRVSGQATLPLVFAVKPVDNSRLRREVNPEHRRECLALLGLGAAIFVCVFLVAWQHFLCVRTGYEIEQFKSQRVALEEWNHQLRLEEASLADPQRIDALARQEGLASPSPQQVIRVGPGGEAPASSVELARSIPVLGPAPAIASGP